MLAVEVELFNIPCEISKVMRLKTVTKPEMDDDGEILSEYNIICLRMQITVEK